MSDAGLRVHAHVRDEVSIARPALRKQGLGRASEQAFPVTRHANPLQVQVRRRVPRRREHEGARVRRPDRRRFVDSPNVALIAVPRVASRSQIPGVESNRSSAACWPSCESATFMYPPGDPSGTARVPSRWNHVGWVMLRAPAQYTTVPLADTAKAEPGPTCSIPSATRIGSPVSLKRFRSSRWAMRVRSRMKKRKSGERKPYIDCSGDTRSRSGESSDAT